MRKSVCRIPPCAAKRITGVQATRIHKQPCGFRLPSDVERTESKHLTAEKKA